MIQEIAFTVYPVSDIARARKFYEGVLGLKLSHNFADKWLEYDIGPGTFAITTMMEECTPGAKGASVAFEVDDLDATVKHLKSHNVPFVMEIFPTSVCRMAVIADPDGNGVTIHKRHPEKSA